MTRDAMTETHYDAAMQSRNKVRLGALFAAVVVTAGLAASIGPAANGVDHLVHHWFASLSPTGQAIARAIGSTLPYWLPGTAIALLACVGASKRQRREDSDTAP